MEEVEVEVEVEVDVEDVEVDVASATQGDQRKCRDLQVVIHHLAHTVDEPTRKRQGVLRRQRRQGSGQAWWARWGGIDVHRLVLGALKSRWRGLRHGPRGSGHARVVFLEDVHHQERDEGADEEEAQCHLDVDPSGS